MSPVEQLKTSIQDLFPNTEIIFRKADDPNGYQFLNIYKNNLEIIIEWAPGKLIEFYHIADLSLIDPLDFAPPPQTFDSFDIVFNEIKKLLI